MTSTLAVMEPRSRDFLTDLIGADLSNAAFPFATLRDLRVGHRPVQARRIKFDGELERDPHIHTEFAQQVLETILSARQAPRLYGSMVVDCCRTERPSLLGDLDPYCTQEGSNYLADFDKGPLWALDDAWAMVHDRD